MRRSQIFARSRTLLERWVLPALAGRDCCDDLQRRGGTPRDLGSIRARQLGRFVGARRETTAADSRCFCWIGQQPGKY